MTDTVRDAITEMLAALPVTNLLTSELTDGYGVDLICVNDFTDGLDETDTNTIASLRQDNYHRLITGAGTLPDDLDYGFDVESFLSRGTTFTELQLMGGQIETELLKDDRNAEVAATVTITSLLPTKLQIDIECTPADPDITPFSMILAVSKDNTLLQAIQ